jgi:tetratricopeptide (TPR) repeat protein
MCRECGEQHEADAHDGKPNAAENAGRITVGEPTGERRHRGLRGPLPGCCRRFLHRVVDGVPFGCGVAAVKRPSFPSQDAVGHRLIQGSISLDARPAKPRSSKDDPDVLWMAANTVSFFTGDHATATDAIDRALRLNPNSAYAWLASGFVSYRQNQPDRAIEAMEQAMRLSPLDPLGYIFTGGLAALHLIAGRYEQAIEWADRSFGKEGASGRFDQVAD